ncbi:hypothetical protein DN824_21925 [Stutzerimonas nosocomialis]|nr:hypothetical protein DN824_21925 [Stutzerimonas nosocomialis]
MKTFDPIGYDGLSALMEECKLGMGGYVRVEAFESLAAENERLNARIAELERDARRYRWLREQEAERGIAVVCITGWERAATCWATTYDPDDLDAAIDTTMTAQAEESTHE